MSAYTDNDWLAARTEDAIAAGEYAGQRLADAQAELAWRRARGATDAGMDAARAQQTRDDASRRRRR